VRPPVRDAREAGHLLPPELLTSLLDELGAPVLAADVATHRILYANAAASELWDARPGELCYAALEGRSEPCPHCVNSELLADRDTVGGSREQTVAIRGRTYRCTDRILEWPEGRTVRYRYGVDITDDLGAQDLTRRYQEHLEMVIEERTTDLVEVHERLQTEVTERARVEEERQELEGRAREAEKSESLAILAGGVAHDFNNIMMAIVGSAQLGLIHGGPDSDMAKLLGRIESAAWRAAKLSRQMLAYSGRGRMVVQNISLAQLMRDMLPLIESSAPPGITVTTEIDLEAPDVAVDPDQIEQVAMSLTANSFEAFAGGVGTVTLRVGTVDRDLSDFDFPGGDGDPSTRYVALEVQDTGCGMDSETLARVFDPYFSTKFQGRGLGLAAVHGIVRGHAGAIAIDSAPSVGTTATVLFPEAAESPPREAGGTQATGPAKKVAGTILVADDDEHVRLVTTEALELAGFDVLTANDGAEAIELFSQRPDDIDALVLDMVMPRTDGIQALRAIQEIRPDVPAILSSGYSEDEFLPKLNDVAWAGFVKKPFDIADLIDRVTACVSSW
jgi:signal transduction histidine kinase